MNSRCTHDIDAAIGNLEINQVHLFVTPAKALMERLQNLNVGEAL